MHYEGASPQVTLPASARCNVLMFIFEVLLGLSENSTIKQLDIRLTGVAKQVNLVFL